MAKSHDPKWTTLLSYLLGLVLGSLATILALPVVADALLTLRALTRSRRSQHVAPHPGRESLLFLVPAHDEELLIERCMRSLQGMEYPSDRVTITVIADNCNDRTAEVAAASGAQVLVRHDPEKGGKSHALQWALSQVPLAQYAAVVIIDADTIVEPDFASRISEHGPLAQKALQTYDGMSNEFDNWLTRLAGLLTRNRYGLQLPLKCSGGVNVPLTGDGTILGTGLLKRVPWHIETITEGWELYTRYTLLGLHTEYVPLARLYAQEAKSLSQSGSQRLRWSSGRLAVFRIYLWRILTGRGLSPLQRLDLVAELTNLGPATRSTLALGVILTVIGAHVTVGPLWAGLSAASILHLVVLSSLSIWKHPQPLATLAALAAFPFYAIWRTAVGLYAFAVSGTGRWTRTGRHAE